jgi:hypothetical protein
LNNFKFQISNFKLNRPQHLDYSNQSKGFIAITTVLIISLVTLAIATTVAMLSINEAQSSLATSMGNDSLTLTEGCAEDALIKSWADNAYSGGSITRPEGSCTITVTKASNVWTITATSTATSYRKSVQITATRTSSSLTVSSWKEI